MPNGRNEITNFIEFSFLRRIFAYVKIDKCFSRNIMSWYAGLVILRAGQDTGMIHACDVLFTVMSFAKVKQPASLGPIDVILPRAGGGGLNLGLF